MTQGLFSPEEVSAMIRAGNKLLLAGDIELLSQLPKGDWIGGTTPYFILHPEHRVASYDKIFVCQIPDYVVQARVQEYDETDIHTIYNDAPQNGFTVLIIPFGSQVAVDFALNSTNYENFATSPLCGWIAGRPLETIMTEKSYAVTGTGPAACNDKAVAMHVTLPEDKYAEIHIFNPYRQGNGDNIRFEYSSTVLGDALINGVKRNFADYLREIHYDMSLPLVANYSGAMINVVCCGIGETETQMSAPVFESLDYRIASIDDSIAEPTLINDRIVFSVTCIGNYIQPDICAQYLKKMNGPVVYGEIAYQLVNQTTVYVTVGEVSHINAEIK
jgi:hypothetical protein